MTITDLLTGTEGSRVVAYVAGRPISLAEFRNDVAANALALHARGCQRGLLVTADTYWAAVGMLALFQAGAVVVMPPNILPETLQQLCVEWDCLVSDTADVMTEAHHRLISGESAGRALQPLDSEACVIELFTSGTTGDPIRVRKTLRQMELEAADIESLFGRHLAEGAPVAGTVTHQHMYGLAYRLFWPLCNKRPIDGTIYTFWEELLRADLRGGAVVSGPSHLTRLAGIPALPAGTRPGLVFSAGAPLPPGTGAASEAILGAPLIEIYGSTETNSIAWRAVSGLEPHWQPFPAIKIDRLPDGRITLTSPYIIGHDRYEGQDLIQLATGGGFDLIGRADRVVKIEGKRVSLGEVERCLRAHPAIAAAAIVVLPEPAPSLAAVVVPSEAGDERLREIGRFRFGRLLRHDLSTRLEAAGLPRRWRFVAALPVNALGKTNTAELRQLFNSTTQPGEPDIRPLERSADWVELEVFNRPDLRQLDGHFPGMPIVPGVAQIDWAVKLAARHLDLPLQAATNYQVKFHRLTLPDSISILRLEHDRTRQRLSFSYRRPDREVLTSGTISLATS